jgi:hypothetical protein
MRSVSSMRWKRTPGGSSGLLVVGGHQASANAQLEAALGQQIQHRRLFGEQP